MKVLVSADSTCLVNMEVLKKNGINVFPLNVIIDGQEYLDGVSIDQETLKNEMRANKKIKTSTPPMGEVVSYFENLLAQGYDKIIHFTISSKLSSMYQLFSNVASSYFEGKVYVVDSYAVSSLMLSHVLFANEEVKKGTDVEKICELVEERKAESLIFFVPENLTALKNGGRISPAIAAVGNMIGLKPVIAFTDGQLVKDTMTRNIKKAFFEKLDSVKEQYPEDKYDYTLISFDANESILNSITEYIQDKLNIQNLVTGIIPINVCAHCGPGTIGMLITLKVNENPLKSFI